MSTETPTISGGLLIKGITKAEDLVAGMFWHADRSSWPHRIASVKIMTANVRITDEYGAVISFRKAQNVPTAVVIGDLP